MTEGVREMAVRAYYSGEKGAGRGVRCATHTQLREREAANHYIYRGNFKQDRLW